MMAFNRFTFPALIAALALPNPAAAHIADGMGAGAWSGFLHPLTGADHVFAMVAVGIWGAILGRPLIVALPVAFPLMMAVGAIYGLAGLPLPGVEIGIALSACVLGSAIFFAARPPVAVAVAIVAFFALFHGYAHGAELPGTASPLGFVAGFVIATGLLHLIGIAIGEGMRRAPDVRIAERVGGGVIAATGLWFLVPAVLS